MTVVLSDITNLNGGDNMPGVATNIWGIYKNDLQTIQVPGADGVTITTAHIPKPGKGFHNVYNTLESGEFKSGNKGGLDGQYQDQNYEGFIPGLRSSVSSYQRRTQNAEMIYIIEDGNGQKIQIGDRKYPAYIKFEAGTGKAGGDEVAGYKMMIKSYSTTTTFYNATIPLAPTGVISGGIGTISIVGSTPGLLTTAKLNLNGAIVDLGGYVPLAGETDVDAAAGLAAAITALGLAGVSATSTGNVVNGVFPSMYDGWNFEFDNTSDEFTGTALLIIGAAGATGDKISVKLGFNGIEIPMGSYTKVGGDTTTLEAAGLAADITANNGMGFTAVNDGNVVNVTVPAGSGLTFNGAVLVPSVTGTITEISTSGEKVF